MISGPSNVLLLWFYHETSKQRITRFVITCLAPIHNIHVKAQNSHILPVVFTFLAIKAESRSGQRLDTKIVLKTPEVWTISTINTNKYYKMLSTLARRSSVTTRVLRPVASIANGLHKNKSTQVKPIIASSSTILHNVEGLILCLIFNSPHSCIIFCRSTSVFEMKKKSVLVLKLLQSNR